MNSSIWLILLIVLIIIEIFTVGLVCIWFAFGALISFIISYFTNSLLIEIPIFIVVSIASLLITRPLIKKYFNNNIIKTNVNKLIGETGIVVENVTKTNMGKIKVGGQIWSALNSEKGCIKENTEVEVLSVEGVKLIVRKKDE